MKERNSPIVEVSPAYPTYSQIVAILWSISQLCHYVHLCSVEWYDDWCIMNLKTIWNATVVA
jgi:hypothetical protein